MSLEYVDMGVTVKTEEVTMNEDEEDSKDKIKPRRYATGARDQGRHKLIPKLFTYESCKVLGLYMDTYTRFGNTITTLDPKPEENEMFEKANFWDTVIFV